jgi:hypothetical protein
MFHQHLDRHMKNYTFLLCAGALFGVLVFASQIHAQQSPQRSLTAPMERHQWVFLCNSETSQFEYDAGSVRWVDSAHLTAQLRETPLKNKYYQVKVTKMWEQRSIQGYSDSLGLHPIYDYAGYENFGYTIHEVQIDLSHSLYKLVSATDYDRNGMFLGVWDYQQLMPTKPLNPAPQTKLVEVLYAAHQTSGH